MSIENPLCRICNHRHSSREPHIFKDVKSSESDNNDSHLQEPKPQKPRKVKPESDKPQKDQSVKTSTNCASLDPGAPERSARWRSNNRAKYNEYMRDYMRRRRSIDK